MTSPETRAIVVMARPLVSGAVKSRLATTLGDEGALAVYERLLAGTLDQAELLGSVDLVLAEAPCGDVPAGRAPAGTSSQGTPPPADPLEGRAATWRRLSQRGTDLGARLAAAFDDVFGSGADDVVVIDSDSPPIPTEYLRAAFAELVTADLVVGPATDGGYFLLGTSRAAWAASRDRLTGLLERSPMGSPALLAFTLHEAAQAGLRVAQVPLWVDVDEPRDLAVLDRLSGEAPLRVPSPSSLREVYLHVTHRCGRDCRHCYDPRSRGAAGELTTDEWRDAIDQCTALGARSFVFIGGDPLLRPDLTELVDHITGANGAAVRFFFNSLVDGRTAGALAGAGRGRLTPLVSVDGPREINDALRGRGSYDDVMASIDHLLSAGLVSVANTVLVRPALPGLAQLARELRAAGLSRMHLILPHQHGGVPSEPGLVPQGAEMLTAVRELLTTAREIGLTVDNLPSWRRRIGRRNDFCAAGCRDLAIDPYGRVHACVITAGDPAFVAGDLRLEPLERIWRASSSLRLLRAARARDRAECLACPVVDACGGECWVQAHYAARADGRPAGYTAPFPYCDLVRPILEELTREEAREREDGRAAPVLAAASGATGGGFSSRRGRSDGAGDYSLFDCI